MNRIGARKPHILFVGEGVSLAHVTRPLVLAQALDPERYDISFACAPGYRHLPEDAGYPFHPLHTMPAQVFLRRLELGAPLYDRRTLQRCVADELELFAALQPDLIVGDFRVSLGISARKARIPHVNVCNAHWSPYSTQPFPTPELPLTRLAGPSLAGWILRKTAPLVFPLHARAFNRLCVEHGLSPVSGLREMYTGGTWTLYLDIPSLAPTSGLSPTHQYLGPPIWSPSAPMPAEITFENPHWPLVYVTLGSSGDTRVLAPLVEALRKMPLNAVVATAGRASLENLPPHIVAVPFVPAIDILKRAELCICSGGSATGYQALSVGVPLLAFPANADQFYFSEAVEQAGAARVLRPSTATVATISAVLQSMLQQRAHKQAARRLQCEMEAHPVAARFRDFIQNSALPSRKEFAGGTPAPQFSTQTCNAETVESEPAVVGASDDALLESIATERNKDAFARFYSRYEQQARNQALRLTGNLALTEDVVQESMLKVWLRAGLYRGGCARAWLLRIVTRESLRLLKCARKRALPASSPAANENDVLMEIERKQMLSSLQQLTSELPAEERSLVRLRFDDGLSQCEISAALRIPQQTVSHRLKKILEALRLRLVCN